MGCGGSTSQQVTVVGPRDASSLLPVAVTSGVLVGSHHPSEQSGTGSDSRGKSRPDSTPISSVDMARSGNSLATPFIPTSSLFSNPLHHRRSSSPATAIRWDNDSGSQVSVAVSWTQHQPMSSLIAAGEPLENAGSGSLMPRPLEGMATFDVTAGRRSIASQNYSRGSGSASLQPLECPIDVLLEFDRGSDLPSFSPPSLSLGGRINAAISSGEACLLDEHEEGYRYRVEPNRRGVQLLPTSSERFTTLYPYMCDTRPMDDSKVKEWLKTFDAPNPVTSDTFSQARSSSFPCDSPIIGGAPADMRLQFNHQTQRRTSPGGHMDFSCDASLARSSPTAASCGSIVAEGIDTWPSIAIVHSSSRISSTVQ